MGASSKYLVEDKYAYVRELVEIRRQYAKAEKGPDETVVSALKQVAWEAAKKMSPQAWEWFAHKPSDELTAHLRLFVPQLDWELTARGWRAFRWNKSQQSYCKTPVVTGSMNREPDLYIKRK